MIHLSQPFEFYKTFIEWYICQTGVHSYLEVGCAGGGLVERVAALPSVRFAVGVDVAPVTINDYQKGSYVCSSSDHFFEHSHVKWDVIFIDADHSAEQVLKDARNAMNALADSGIVLLHDTFPPTEDYTNSTLCGTAFLARDEIEQWPSVQAYTFPVTYGLTLLSHKEQPAWR